MTERRSLACARFSIPRRPFTVHSVRCREAHSEKPQLVYEIIERMYPALPKLELFARGRREGWSAWGNQAAYSRLVRQQRPQGLCHGINRHKVLFLFYKIGSALAAPSVAPSPQRATSGCFPLAVIIREIRKRSWPRRSWRRYPCSGFAADRGKSGESPRSESSVQRGDRTVGRLETANGYWCSWR